MSRAELAELSRDPLSEIGAHGWSHRALAGLPPELLKWEVEGNVRTLVETTGLPVVSFAYPFGGPQTAETRAVLREAGIPLVCVLGEEAVTALTDHLSMPRLEVRDCGADELADRLERVLNS
jgi:peptidoglycan/xylan/chitin deacetylase (PgdA/CDA1 family)